MKAKTGLLRVPTMPASEGRGLDWSKAQNVVFPNLKPSTVAFPNFVVAAQKYGKEAPHTSATPLEELSQRHAARTKCRALDLLHVSHAAVAGIPRFFTGDQRQAELAKLVGLRVEYLRI